MDIGWERWAWECGIEVRLDSGFAVGVRRVEGSIWLMGLCGRTSLYTGGSSLADGVVEENGRTYHVFKDGSEFSKMCCG